MKMLWGGFGRRFEKRGEWELNREWYLKGNEKRYKNELLADEIMSKNRPGIFSRASPLSPSIASKHTQHQRSVFGAKSGRKEKTHF